MATRKPADTAEGEQLAPVGVGDTADSSPLTDLNRRLAEEAAQATTAEARAARAGDSTPPETPPDE